jgi:hypothetical protein
MGATLDLGAFGPSGEAAGSQCWLKVNMPGDGEKRNLSGGPTLTDPTLGVHSAKLREESRPDTVSFYSHKS